MKVFVTGASSGIGAATVMAFAAAGHEVGMCARRADRLESLAAECGPAVRWWSADLSELDGLDALAATVDESMGGVDVVVNNAGVPKRRRVRAMTGADLESVMRINYFSPARLSLAFAARMLERGSGEIINISSMGVHTAAFGVGAYSASKAALELFTEALYLELLPAGVRARVLVPGTTRTEFSEDKPDNEPSMMRGAPDGATAEEVAAAIVASVGTSDYIRYATEKDAATSAAKAADPNAFVARAQQALAAFL